MVRSGWIMDHRGLIIDQGGCQLGNTAPAHRRRGCIIVHTGWIKVHMGWIMGWIIDHRGHSVVHMG